MNKDKDYKDLCQVFTPDKNVIELLNWCGYKNDIFHKKIIENSCGNGQILKEVVRRYVEDSLKNNRNIREIKKGLEDNIYGIEYDFEKYNECKTNLDEVVKQYGITSVNWKNIKNGDALENIIENKFDFVVGNPPYIKYKSLDINDRILIRNKFITCESGKFDYCYAFIEASIMMMKDDGIMAYLIPSSIFKNVFAENLREYIKPHLLKVYDYSIIKLFTKDSINSKNRLTSSAIMVLKKNSNQNYIDYIDVANKRKVKINKNNLNGKWIFAKQRGNNKKGRRFGDYFHASNTIATLCNEAFIIKEYEEDEKYIYPANGGRIEKTVIKDTVSPKTFDRKKVEKIIFPYYYENKELKRYEKSFFEKKFKGTCEYLENYKEQLDKRKSDANASWYEYGRSQALKNSNKEKLLLSTIITNEVKTKILSNTNVPYSGIYIISIKNKTLEEADKILKSKDFFNYIKGKGINASGKSLRITSKDINEYRF